MSILSDQEIRDEHKKGNIVISPFNPALVQPASYDITLGPWYFKREKPAKQSQFYVLMALLGIAVVKMWYDNDAWSRFIVAALIIISITLSENRPFNPFSGRHRARYWESKASYAQHIYYDYNHELDLPRNAQYIILYPGETILGHSQEFIGSAGPIAGMLKTRSSIGRSDIETCSCAGFIDPGFTNRLCLEIRSRSDRPIVLVVGKPLGQVVFIRTGPIKDSYTAKNGSYQQLCQDQSELEKAWHPDQLLPKMKA